MAAEKQPETTAPQVEKPPTGEPAPNTKPALGEDDEFEDFPSEGTLPTPSTTPPSRPTHTPNRTTATMTVPSDARTVLERKDGQETEASEGEKRILGELYRAREEIVLTDERRLAGRSDRGGAKGLQRRRHQAPLGGVLG